MKAGPRGRPARGGRHPQRAALAQIGRSRTGVGNVRVFTLIDHGDLIIPAGNYFVLGDNRNDSEDSRYWGFVPRANIVGNPIVIYFSLQQPDTDDISDFGDENLSPTLKPTPPQPIHTRHGLDARCTLITCS